MKYHYPMHVPWSLLVMSSSALQGCLAFTSNRSGTRLEYFRKYSISDSTIRVTECKHVQLMLRDLSLKPSQGWPPVGTKLDVRASVSLQAVRTPQTHHSRAGCPQPDVRRSANPECLARHDHDHRNIMLEIMIIFLSHDVRICTILKGDIP